MSDRFGAVSQDMPLYRCNACGYVAEETLTPPGKPMPCARCAKPVTVFGTVFYVEKLLERYTTIWRELQALRAADDATSAEEPAAAASTRDDAPEVRDTVDLATAEQHAPLRQWFAARQIDATFTPDNVNTAGYFDDAAQLLGEGHALFGELIDRVCWSYRNAHTGLNLELARLPQKDAQAINQLCRDFYGHTFFSRYHYQKQEKVVRLGLQPAPVVRRFFEGEWLEWYALTELLATLQRHAPKQAPSVARSAKVVFANEDLHELDVVGLLPGQAPITIECKTGEFRRDIDKLLRLRKRLNVPRDRFIVCAIDLDDAQAASLNAMYEMSFVNLRGLRPHLAKLLT